MFCLELKQEGFTISENHVTLGDSACDVCVSVAYKFGDAAHRVQAADDFTPPSAQLCLSTYMGNTHYL